MQATATTNPGIKPKNLRQQFVEITRRFVTEAPKLGLDDPKTLEACERIAKIVDSGIFRIVAMGEVKKGKSSFINAFLGISKLLPFDDDVATSTTFKIVYGETERYQVVFESQLERNDLDEDDQAERKYKEVPPLDIDRDHREKLYDYGTEKGNPGNVKGVAFIVIYLPNPILKEGVTFSDTPGLGGLHKRHREVTVRNVPNADVVLFFVDSVESVIGKEEIDFIKQLWKETQHIVFVQTKTDLAEEEQTVAWKERNIQIISSALGIAPETLSYFCVSSELKRIADETNDAELLEASGFDEFNRFFYTALVPGRDRLMLRRFLPGVQEPIVRQKQLITDKLTIAKESGSKNKPVLEKYEQDLKQALEDFTKWQNETSPTIQREYRHKWSELLRVTRVAIDDGTAPETTVRYLEQAKRECKSARDVIDRNNDYRSEHAAECNSYVNHALADFQRSFESFFSDVTGQTIRSIDHLRNRLVLANPGELRSRDLSLLEMTQNSWMKSIMPLSVSAYLTRNPILLGLAKWTGIIVTPAIGSVFSLVLTATVIGTFLYSLRRNQTQHLAAALASLEAAMLETCRNANKAARREFEELAAGISCSAEEQLFEFQKQFRSEFEQRKLEIEIAKKRTADETRAEIERLMAQVRTIDSIDRSINDISSQVQAMQ